LNRNLKTYLNLLWQSVLFWVLAYSLFTTIRLFDQRGEEILDINQEIIDVSYGSAMIYSIILGVLVGVFYSIIEFIFEKYVSKRIKLWVILVSKTLVYLITIVAVFSFIRLLFQVQNDVEVDLSRGWWQKDLSFWVGILYFVIGSVIFSFIKIAIEKFGRKNFMNILLGTYKNPKEEKRIFMFLDLKDSTTIAEDLGHFKYSRFIQDCFYDLDEVVSRFDAEIYQYVGDEAVLTWDYKKGLANNNCLELFFSFQQRLLYKTIYYQDKYGIIPKFKAGIHGGKLIVSEVGTIKKELAYHGDVINTTARIQAECNTYNSNLLISETLFNSLHLDSQIESTFIGKVLLKGKHKEVSIFSLSNRDIF